MVICAAILFPAISLTLQVVALSPDAPQLCQNYIQQQRYLEAVSACQNVVEAARRRTDRAIEADALYNLGLVYEAVSRSWDAIATLKQAQALYQATQNSNGEANVLNRLGDVYRARSQYEWAIDFYQQAYSLYVRQDNLQGQATALMNLGAAYQAKSDYLLATNHFEDALSRFYAANNRPGQAKALMSLGGLDAELGQYQRAIGRYREALAIVKSIGDREGGAEGLVNLGNVQNSLSQPQAAIALNQEALPLFLSVNDVLGEAKTWLSLGNAYYALNQQQSAQNAYQKALRLFQGAEERNGAADALQGLGTVYLKQGQTKLAIVQFQKALAIYQDIGDRNGEAITLGSLGEAFVAQGDLDQGETCLRESIQLLESIRLRVRVDRDRISLFETYQNPYVNLQRVLIAKNQPLKGLEIAEQGRARAFVALLEHRLSAANRASSAPAAVITIADIKQVAKTQNATLVEYSILEGEALYIWVAQPNGEIKFAQVSLEDLPREGQRSGLDQLVNLSRVEDLEVAGRGITFIEQPEVPNLIAVAATQGNNYPHLKQLHQILIAPIAQYLPSDPDQQVIFLPQGSLFFVPFSALQTAEGHFLIEKHTITTAPSIAVLQLTQQQRQTLVNTPERSSLKNALIVGNPTMPKIGEPPQQLSSLPGAEAEARAIAQMLNTQPLIGAKATKIAVVEQMQSARLVHLATHGLLDDYKGLGMPGAVALAPSGENANSQQRTSVPNGLLTADEISNLKLKAELVVLSACDTGRGRITGDGVIGLSRALISAGAPSIIVSLWKVPDDSTSILMQEFYQNLQRSRVNKAQALRQATLKAKDQFPDPREWAAFTLIGEAA